MTGQRGEYRRTPERQGVVMADAAYEQVATENALLRTAITDAILACKVGYDGEARVILEAAVRDVSGGQFQGGDQ